MLVKTLWEFRSSVFDHPPFIPPFMSRVYRLKFLLHGVSFPPKTGPLFWHGKGICDGSETTFGRGHTEAAA